MKIVATRRRLSLAQRFSVPKLLAALGVEFRRGEFWEANRFILRELYAEAQSEVRERIKELHPDRPGGDSDAVRILIEHWRQAQKAFARYLPAQLNPSTVRIISFEKSVFDFPLQRRRRRINRWHRKKQAFDQDFRRKHRARVNRWKRENPQKVKEQKQREYKRRKRQTQTAEMPLAA